MPTRGFVDREGIPAFVSDNDNDGGFTLHPLLRLSDGRAMVKQFASANAFGGLHAYAPGTSTVGLLHVWTAFGLPGRLRLIGISAQSPVTSAVTFEIRLNCEAVPFASPPTIQPGDSAGGGYVDVAVDGLARVELWVTAGSLDTASTFIALDAIEGADLEGLGDLP